jgi:hypothetical protein
MVAGINPGQIYYRYLVFFPKRKFPQHILFSHFDEQKIPLAIKKNVLFIVFSIYSIFRYLSSIFNDKLESNLSKKRYKDVSLKYVFPLLFYSLQMVIKRLKINFGRGGGALPPWRALPCSCWGLEAASRSPADFPNFSRKGSFPINLD